MERRKIDTKRIVCYVLGAVIVTAAVVLGIVFGVKKKEDDLKLSIEDITLEVDETVPILYKINNGKATIDFRVINEKVVTLDKKENTLTGKMVGETQLIVVARYKSMVCDKRVKVRVLEKNNPADTTPPPDSEDNPTDPIDPNPQTTRSIFLESNSEYCSVNDCELTLVVNKTAYLNVSLDGEGTEFDIVGVTEGLVVSKLPDIQLAISLKATEVGDFGFKIKVGEIEETFVVHVA